MTADAPPRGSAQIPQRSIVVDVAVRVALATALTAAVLFGAIYIQLGRATRDLVQGSIDTDLAGLVDSQSSLGTAGMAQRIADRLAFTPSSGEQPYYRLEDAGGHALAGNLPTWPAARAALSEAGETRLANGTPLRFRVTLLRGGTRLLVGRSMAGHYAYLRQIGAWFAAGLLVMAATAYAIGRQAAQRFNRRIGTINRVFGGLGDDGAAARAPVSARHDEIDILSSHLNTVLDRVTLLMMARKDMSDAIAHETRSPLMHINARIAKARMTPLPAETDRLLDATQADIRALQRMLDALLDIASSEAQRGEMNSLPDMDLSEIATRLSELYGPTAEDRGLRFSTAIAPGVTMRGEPVQISSLLVNLLDNAFKYGATTPGKYGATAPGETGTGAIRLIVRDGPEIVVEDEGEGVDPAIRDQVFERFYRTRRDGQGHGLGLALVRAIAERHGLTVRLEDTMDHGNHRGARFVVR